MHARTFASSPLRTFAPSHTFLPVTNPYLVRDPPNFLTYDAEELEEFLTDETATAEEPHPDEADELSSLCRGPLALRGVHFQHSLLRQWIHVTHAHWLRRHLSHIYAGRK